MAVPKRRKSRARTHSRRSQWKASVPELVEITVAGRSYRVPRRLVAHHHRFPEELED